MNKTNPTDVLVVSDEPEIRDLLKEYLTAQALKVAVASNAVEVSEIFDSVEPVVAVLDFQSGATDDATLASWIREHYPETRTIVLTVGNDGPDNDGDEGTGAHTNGADAFVPKPFDLRELVVRVRALMRRSVPELMTTRGTTPTEAIDSIRIGTCELDIAQRQLRTQDGRNVPITAAEFDLLCLFARHPNRVLSRDEIMEQAHNRGWVVSDRSIDLRIMRLRRKIEINPNTPTVLRTVRTVGYLFDRDAAPT